MRIKITMLLLLMSLPLLAQWENKTMEHSSKSRNYRLYIPKNYNASVAASLVIAFHGWEDGMEHFSSIIEIEKLADADNCIVVCPEALENETPGFKRKIWNSGAVMAGISMNSGVDDVGFISSLIDKISAEYTVDPNKVFSFGFCMGGFMAQRLAIELNTKIKIIASVGGTMGKGILPVPEDKPGRPISIAHFHGTNDPIVAYAGNPFGNSVSELIDFWRANNKSDSEPELTFFPDLANDGYTVEHYRYRSTVNTSVIELFQVNNARHKWLVQDINDISYTAEILKFFKRVYALSQTDFQVDKTELVLFPNPVTANKVNLKLTGTMVLADGIFELLVYDGTGRKVVHRKIQLLSGNYTLSIENLQIPKGIYFVELTGNDFKTYKKMVVN